MSRAWRPNPCCWRIAQPFDGAADLARQLSTSPLVAQVLYNRGVGELEAARSFLSPKLSDLRDPLELAGCQQAAQRIIQAVRRRERIVIYGDYDVDGITGVAILHAMLRLVGTEAHYYVPHRLEEGYGVNAEAVAKLVEQGARLLITVDCGISAAGPLAAAVGAGVDVIVTDHHSPPTELPAVSAIVHPGVPSGHYRNPHLSGAGVAFKLAWQVAREMGGATRVSQALRDFLLEATCLAALGTIADVVPLVGENRSLATHGLLALPATRHVGLRALLESANLAGERLDAYHVGFLLAPRLNACGRMGHAQQAVELLTTATADQARQIAGELARRNAQRQKVEREITEQAIQMVRAAGMDGPDRRCIVLAGDAWHGGVIGIVASRLVSQFNRPALLIACNGEGLGQGSGRSVPGFHLRDALAACSQHLESFGGHAMAGGLRIRRERIDQFAAALEAYARAVLGPQPPEAPLDIDARATLAELSYNAVEHLERLAPFGQGNPPPVLCFEGCQVLSPPRPMGRSGQTVSLVLGQGGHRVRAVGFSMGSLVGELGNVRQVDMAAQPKINRFNGQANVELELCDVRW
jgi:single-stranded-DNA-specific exonuclease